MEGIRRSNRVAKSRDLILSVLKDKDEEISPISDVGSSSPPSSGSGELRRSERLSKMRKLSPLRTISKTNAMAEESPPKRTLFKQTSRKRCGGPLPKQLIMELAKEALSIFNEGPEYEVVDPGQVYFNMFPMVYHCNFIARPKNGTKADDVLFFAEFRYFGDGTPRTCTVCRLLGPKGTVTGRRGCKICPCDHPPHVPFVRKSTLEITY